MARKRTLRRRAARARRVRPDISWSARNASVRRSRRADRQRTRDLGARGARRRGGRVRRHRSRRPPRRPRASSKPRAGAPGRSSATSPTRRLRADRRRSGARCSAVSTASCATSASGSVAGSRERRVEEWDTVHAVNVRSHFLVCRAALPVMDDGGAIVFISSVAGLKPGTRIPAYDTTKAALAGLSRHVAFEGARRGIRANVVAPGPDRHAARPARDQGRPSRGARRCRSAARQRRGRSRRRSCSC